MYFEVWQVNAKALKAREAAAAWQKVAKITKKNPHVIDCWVLQPVDGSVNPVILLMQFPSGEDSKAYFESQTAEEQQAVQEFVQLGLLDNDSWERHSYYDLHLE